MKILTLHSDFIEFEPVKKAIKSAEEVDKKPVRVEECLVVLTSVEKRDESDPKKAIEKYISEVQDVAKQVNTKTIVLYPYAHLSSNLANPDAAVKIMKEAEKELKKQYKVIRAPFGWYKKFDIKCKGHPLAELSREFGSGKEEKVSESVKKEEKLKSEWFIIDVDGKLYNYEKFDFSKHKNLKIFSGYEREKVRRATEEPAHVSIMKKLELVDYELGSDPGNLRYYPKGRLIKSLLETYTNKRVADYGGMEVETPIMYDMQHPTLASYLNRFPARQYTIESDRKNYFLRFAACFGQFLMAHDANISYKNLPLKLYELTRYSFRREQKGELTGLRRLRAFTMPDVHALCSDMHQAIDEFKIRFQFCMDVQKQIGIAAEDYELAIRVTKEFYEKNKELLRWMVKTIGKPALVEMWNERIFYFVIKYEFNFVDSLNKASALSTDQIDIENGERYNITFTDKDGKKKHPIILHCSPTGAIERVIYALLEKAYFDQQKGKKPMLPVWLSPTQLRIIPVSEKFLKDCEKLLWEFKGIRVDLDDRELHVGKKIREAEMEWVPYIIVYGEKEKESGRLSVRLRKDDKQERFGKQELIETIKSEIRDMPFLPLPLPKEISRRPVFVG